MYPAHSIFVFSCVLCGCDVSVKLRTITRHAMWREANMKSNQFWTAVSKVLAVITVTLIMALMLAPGAWAASTYKTLYKFTGDPDGDTPLAALIFDASGNLYSTTLGGGSGAKGTVFKLTPNADGSWTQSVLYGFTGGSDGGNPFAGVIFDASGSLYGTTYNGASGGGTVYKLTPNSDGTWTESTLHQFHGSDGRRLVGGLVFDATGNLYGTARWVVLMDMASSSSWRLTRTGVGPRARSMISGVGMTGAIRITAT
jgi:uncharacterized repeat protein (TIGR03803 family)